MAAIPGWAIPIVKQRSDRAQNINGTLDVRGNYTTRSVILNPTKTPQNIQLVLLSRDHYGSWSFGAIPGTTKLGINNDGNLPASVNCFPDVYTNNFDSFKVNADIQTIPTSLQIKTIRKVNPKLDITTTTQNAVIQLGIKTREIFTYPFNPALPNHISFDLSNLLFPESRAYFVRDYTGVIDLPGVMIFFLPDDIMRISNIPPDANGDCSAMLFII